MDNHTTIANNTARAIVKAVEEKQGIELDLNLCLAIVGLVGGALEQSEARAERMTVALEAVEWRASGAHFHCQWCYGLKDYGGHKPDCQRQLALHPATAPAEGEGE